MKKLVIALVFFGFVIGAGAMATAATLPIVPAPQQWEPAGGVCDLSQLARIVVDVDDEQWRELEAQSAPWLGPVLGQEPGPGHLLITRDTDLPDDQYRLEVRPSGITLTAGTPTSAFSGLMTLTQLSLHGASIPCGLITDSPRFGWRGMLLDCGRHFMPVPLIKEVLDALALHKFNVLHWHLTEDQGWRLEVPGLPGLTETAAWRTGPDGQRVGGFYTTEDVREIVAYAAERHITVVPEIEMPGHTVAVLAAYPELSCSGGPFDVETQWGIHPDIFCAGNDEVFAFLEKVLTHVMDLFPSTYIHLGGDEAPKERWQVCDRCQARMRDEGLANEAELQSWFIGRMEKFLASHGRQIIGWDEILEGGLVENSGGATIQSWRGTDGAIAAARAGHDAIVSPTSHAYFDYDPGVLDVQQVHGFNPVPKELNENEARHILGGEMNLWTEYIPPERLPRMIAPRMAAMAEALWTGTNEDEFPTFLARLEQHQPVWDHLGWTPGAAARPVTISGRYDIEAGQHKLRFELDERLRAVFAGDELVIRHQEFARADYPDHRPEVWPDEQSPAVVNAESDIAPEELSRPCSPGEPAVLHLAQLFVRGQAYGAPALAEWNPHLALGRPVTLADPASSRYPGGSVGWLVDGQRGGPSFRGEHWAGFEGVGLNATVDLGQITEVNHLSVRFLQDANSWIFLPTEVRFAWSEDGTDWHELPAITHALPDKEQRKVIQGFAVAAGGIKARYVRIQGLNREICPDWHPGKGLPCWVFADELVVR